VAVAQAENLTALGDMEMGFDYSCVTSEWFYQAMTYRPAPKPPGGLG